MTGLKNVLESELDAARLIGAVDGAGGGRTKTGGRQGEVRRIGEVESLKAELQAVAFKGT